MIRVIVAGSRTVAEGQVREALRRCPWIGFATAVVSGTAAGADEFGEKWAAERGLEVLRFPADWKQFGRRAGPIRNKVMAENADGLVAVWDGKSRGTRSMIELARRRGLRVFVYRTDVASVDSIEPHGPLQDLWEAVEERAAIKEHSTEKDRAKAEREAALELARPEILAAG